MRSIAIFTQNSPVKESNEDENRRLKETVLKQSQEIKELYSKIDRLLISLDNLNSLKEEQFRSSREENLSKSNIHEFNAEKNPGIYQHKNEEYYKLMSEILETRLKEEIREKEILKSGIITNNGGNESLERIISDLKSQLSYTKAQLRKFEEEEKLNERRRKEFQEDFLLKVENLKKSNELHINQLKEELHNKDRIIHEQDNKINHLTHAINNQKSSIINVQEKENTMVYQIKQYEKEIESSSFQLKTLKSELLFAENQIQTLKSQMMNSDNKITKITSTYKASISELDEQIEVLKKENDSLKVKISIFESNENSVNKEKFNHLAKEIKIYAENNEKKLKTIQILEDENSRQRFEITQLKNIITEIKNANRPDSGKVIKREDSFKLREEISKLKEKLALLACENERLNEMLHNHNSSHSQKFPQIVNPFEFSNANISPNLKIDDNHMIKDLLYNQEMKIEQLERETNDLKQKQIKSQKLISLLEDKNNSSIKISKLALNEVDEIKSNYIDRQYYSNKSASEFDVKSKTDELSEKLRNLDSMKNQFDSIMDEIKVSPKPYNSMKFNSVNEDFKSS